MSFKPKQVINLSSHAFATRPESATQPPATPYQVLAEKLFPLVSMLVVFGGLQLLSAFYYDPINLPVTSYQAPLEKEELPFPILVRNTRVGLGLSRKALGRLVSLSGKNIEDIEEGDATPTKEIEIALRKALKIPLENKEFVIR